MDDDKGDDGKHLPWNDGLPTKPDVDLLLKTWPQPKPGDRFEYAAIEKLLRVKRTDVRFRTVTSAWRRRVLDQFHVVIEADPGECFYAPTPDQVAGRTYGVLKFIGRKARGQVKKLAVAKPETDELRNTIEHQGRLVASVAREIKKTRMNILPSTEAKAPPQIAPPKQPDTKEEPAPNKNQQ